MNPSSRINAVASLLLPTRSRTRRYRTARLATGDRHLFADDAGYAAGLFALHLSRNPLHARLIRRVADLATRRVGHFASSGLTGVAACPVRNLLRVAFLLVGARGVGHLLGNGFADVAANRVRNFLRVAFLHVGASRVGHPLRAAFFHVTANRVRDAFCCRAGNLTAHGVRHTAVFDFLHVPCAADLPLDDFRAPHFAANLRRRALHFDRLAAARFVDAATSAAIVFPSSWAANTLLDDRTGNALADCFPLAATFLDDSRLGDRLADCVAVVAIASFLDCLVRRAANVAVAGFVNRLADGVANVAVAGFVARLARCVADVAVAALVNRTANRAADIAVARFVARLAGGVADVTVARFVNRLANGETFVAIAGLVDVLRASDGNLLANRIVDGLAAGVFLLVPDDFLNRLVTCFGTAFRFAVIAAGAARAGWTAVIAGRATITRLGGPGEAGCQQQSCQSGDPGEVAHGLVSYSTFNAFGERRVLAFLSFVVRKVILLHLDSLVVPGLVSIEVTLHDLTESIVTTGPHRADYA